MFPARIPIVSVPPSGFKNTYSLAFDGSDDYIDCGNDASLQITGNMTVSAWVKSSSSDRQRFITKYGSGGDDSFYLAIRPSTGYFRFNAASGEAESSTDVADGNWHHLVAQYTTSTKLEVFIDGSSDGTDTSSIDATMVNSTQNLRIGIESDDEFPMVGNIDEVSIFNAIVSVGDLRNGSSGQGNAVPADLTGMSNLQGWWRMGDGDLDDGNVDGNGLICDQTNATLTETIINQVDRDFSGSNNWSASSGNITLATANNQLTITRVSGSGNSADLVDAYINFKQDTIYKVEIDVESYTGTWDVYDTANAGHFKRINATGLITLYKKSYVGYPVTGIRLRQPTAETAVIVLNSISFKEVGGNAGVMVNMRASDIVSDTP